MNQVLKYIKFTVFLLFITMFIGTIGVDAKTCVYDYEWKELATTYYAHAEFDISNAKSQIMLLNKSNSYTSFGYDEHYYTIDSKGSFSKEGAESGSCPTVYFHLKGGNINGKGYNITVYQNKKDCKNGIFSCKENRLASVKGTLKYDENDKKECSKEEKELAADDFANGIAIYANNIQKNIDNYKIRILGAITATGRSDESIKSEIESIISGYTAYTSQAGDGILNLASNKKYECLTEAAIKSELDYITKIANEGLLDINEYKNKVFSQEIERRQTNGEDTSGLEGIVETTTDYINNTIDQLQELIEKYKAKVPDLKLGGFDVIVSPTCKNILGSVVSIVQEIFDWIKIIAPVLLILFGSMDYAKAVISNDNDILKKATNNFIKRAIAAVAIFFLPYLVNLLLNLPGIKEAINMGNDPLCSVNKVVIK